YIEVTEVCSHHLVSGRAALPRHPTFPHHSFCASKISSIGSLNTRETLKASGRLGSYRSVSIAFTVCRETPSLSARSDCDHSFAVRNSRIRFLIDSGGGRCVCSRRTTERKSCEW